MTLEAIVEAIKTFPGVTRKKAIKSIVGLLPADSFSHVMAYEGEDAAAIEFGDNYLLFATDGIMESLVNTDPYFAGYYAVLVNVNDIAAMGGKSMAMVDVMSLAKSKVCNQILRGMGDAVEKFQVPIVGGHTHPDCKYNAIDISIMGSVPKDDIILSCSAQDGDDIFFVMDLDGFYPEGLKYAFDTTSKKDAALVRAQLDLLPYIGSKHLVHSGKDMSNPGCIGTLGMMLETSGMGGYVDVDKIPVPEGADLIQWILAYQGFGFVFACPPESSETLTKLFDTVGCTSAVVGKVDSSKKLILNMGDESKVLFDFDNEIITGCTPKRKC